MYVLWQTCSWSATVSELYPSLLYLAIELFSQLLNFSTTIPCHRTPPKTLLAQTRDFPASSLLTISYFFFKKGLPYITSAKFWDFLTPSPLSVLKIYTVCPQICCVSCSSSLRTYVIYESPQTVLASERRLPNEMLFRRGGVVSRRFVNSNKLQREGKRQGESSFLWEEAWSTVSLSLEHVECNKSQREQLYSMFARWQTSAV